MGTSARGGRLPEAERHSRVLAGSRSVTLRGVAFLVPGFDLDAGMEAQARSLARGLADQGVPATVFTTLPPGLDLPLREPLGLIEVFRIPTLPHVDWHTTMGLFELAALGILRGRVGRLNLIYAVQHETGAMASRVGQALGLPVVVKLACGGEFGDGVAALAHRDRTRILAGLRSAERVVAITAQIADEAERLLDLDPDRIVRLTNGVDRTTFCPRPWREDLPLKVVYVGRLSPQKHVDVLLRAFARLPEGRPTLGKVDLVLAGAGPLRGELEALAHSLGVSERVSFLGAIERSQVVELLRDASVLALPSSAEGMSNSILEALATGVPVVATDLPGTSEQITHEREGLLVPVGDVEALTQALGRVLSDPALQRTLGEAAQARAEAFDIEQVALQHLELFESLAVPRDERPQDARPLLNADQDLPLALQAGSTALRTASRGVRSLLRAVRGRLLPGSRAE